MGGGGPGEQAAFLERFECGRGGGGGGGGTSGPARVRRAWSHGGYLPCATWGAAATPARLRRCRPWRRGAAPQHTGQPTPSGTGEIPDVRATSPPANAVCIYRQARGTAPPATEEPARQPTGRTAK